MARVFDIASLPSPRFRALALLVLTCAAPGLAQQRPEHGAVRVGYSYGYRRGTQTDAGPGLAYRGYSPNNLSADGWYFPLPYFGFTAGLERESYSLLDNQARVTGGVFVRGYVGPAGRLVLGPTRLEAWAAYSGAQVPLFSDTVAPQQVRATRHALMLGGRFLVDWPWRGFLEIRGDYPIGLGAGTSDGAGASIPGFDLGAGLRFPLFTSRATGFQFAALAQYRFVQDRVEVEDGRVASQFLNRFGVALELAFGDPEPESDVPTVGSVRVQVRGADGAAVDSPVLEWVSGDGVRPFANTDAGYVVTDLPPGSVRIRASAPGYVPSEVSGDVKAGEEALLSVVLEREAPKVGNLVVRVVKHGTKLPVKGANVMVGETPSPLDSGGEVTIFNLPVGPVSVAVTASGYRPGNETASIVIGQTVELVVSLVPQEVKLPAMVSGIVRNARTDAPVAATLEFLGSKLKLKANAQGAFKSPVTGGTYRVRISAPGFITQTKSFGVREGDEAIFNVDLYPSRRGSR
ncbi:MAG: collagen binding domain-containing protein [Myxococcaceae bacterium]